MGVGGVKRRCKSSQINQGWCEREREGNTRQETEPRATEQGGGEEKGERKTCGNRGRQDKQ